MYQTRILQFHRILGNRCRRFQIPKPREFYSQKRQIRILWNWFIAVFNSVDRERLPLLGPDCVCAEWLLRNGAEVRFKGHPTLLSDYDTLIALEESEPTKLKVEEIYAKGAALNDTGFEHLRDCNHIKKITLIFCSHLSDSALFKLNYVKHSLEHLELISCFNVQDDGLKSLGDLKNLKILKLAHLVSVKNKVECEVALKKALPQCAIEFEMDYRK